MATLAPEGAVGSYLDTSAAELIALTRSRRAEYAAARDALRQAHEALTFPAVPTNIQQEIEASWREREAYFVAPWTAWKVKQWEAGNRHCGFCGIRMTRDPNTPRTCTVDHRKPRAYGGIDMPDNWILCCSDCNGRKGLMSEANFRTLIASETTARARRLTA